MLGFTGGGFGGTRNTARVFAELKPLDERNLSVDQVIARLRGKLAKVPGATLYLQAVQDVRVGGRPSNAQYQFTLQGESLARAQRVGARACSSSCASSRSWST